MGKRSLSGSEFANLFRQLEPGSVRFAAVSKRLSTPGFGRLLPEGVKKPNLEIGFPVSTLTGLTPMPAIGPPFRVSHAQFQLCHPAHR
jgi:hypothetical protein